jgi:hypothetical protein
MSIHSEISMTIIQSPINVLAVEILKIFDGDNAKVYGNQFKRRMSGPYLQFMRPIMSVDGEDGNLEKDKALTEIRRCATLVSTMHGEFVAQESHFSCIYNLNDNIVTVATDPIYVRQTKSTEHINQGLAAIIDQERSFTITGSEKCLDLISRAHHERDSTVKFLFMWLALEAALGDGKARRNFALGVMKSDALNDIINSLRDRRSLIVHDGENIVMEQLEYITLKAIVLMAMSGNHNIRTRLLEYVLSIQA